MKKRIIAIIILFCMIGSAIIPIVSINQEYDEYEVEPQMMLVQESLSNNTYVFEEAEETILDPYEEAILMMQQEMSEIENITNKKEWFISYKNIVEKYSDILDPPETLYDYFTEEELNTFFGVVQAEIGDEYSFEQKANVASVILNRIEHDRFPNTMLEVLTADQFSTIRSERYKKVEVSETTILACEYAFMIEDTTDGCLFFDSNNALKYEFVFNDGAHNFYKIKGE